MGRIRLAGEVMVMIGGCAHFLFSYAPQIRVIRYKIYIVVFREGMPME